ncbi:hypothetical protein [Circovirus-like genome DHCV-2]|uniref:Uncharacterized protein n=1 Tax=Circovirus-like genome DHCV-2 TaxID=1788451 RepID=A0A190WHD5_9VIRU|nr:hypothetical protein [Circovirus-like genome DHCV-2]AMB42997.1 hypothetical protein [Circovirus-like genome DHCV-2]
MPISRPIYSPEQNTFEASWNLELEPDFSIGRSLFNSRSPNVLRQSRNSLVNPFTPSRRDPRQLSSTFGRKILESMERNSNSETVLLDVTIKRTGTRSETTQNQETWTISPPMFTFAVTIPSDVSASTILSLLQSRSGSLFSGAQLAQGSLDEPGKKPESVLILKTPGPSFGMGTVAMSRWLSMNFGAALIYPICSDGWIGTLLL